jgi:hypothetical protein
MAWDLIEALREHCEAAVLRLVALGAATGAGFLVATDLAHSPPRQFPPADPAAGTAALPGPAVPSASTIASGVDRSIAKVEAAAERRAEMTDVTLFRRVPIEFEGRALAVVTGLVYATSTSAVPVRGFCYLEVGGTSPATEVTVRLAMKDGESPVRPAELSEKDALAVALPLERLRAAAASCRFL